MKIKTIDAPTIRNKRTCTLERSGESGLPNIELTCYALSSNYVDDINDELPGPKPKVKGWARDKRGRIAVDSNGKQVKEYEDDDPDYLKEQSRINQLQMVALIYYALDPEEVQWTTTRESVSEADAFFTAIRAEMREYGLSIGDMAKLVDVIKDVSDIDADDIEKGKEDFFDEAS